MRVGLHHVALGVSDSEKAVKFHTEGLGFEVVQRSDFDNDDAAANDGRDLCGNVMECYEIKSPAIAQLAR